MSYPRNAASPPEILTKLTNRFDGEPIVSDAAVYVIPEGGVRTEGAGTLIHVGNGIWSYTPTQNETDHRAFSVEFHHDDAVSKGHLVQVLTDKRVDALHDYDGSDTPGTTTLLSRLTDTRSGYLDKLNVSGTLAHSDDASLYRSDVSGIPAAVWANEARSLTDKAGFALTSDYDAAKTAAQPGDAMALTAVERLNLAAALEAAIIDDLDGTAVMEAIANLISSEIDAAGLSVETFAVALRDAVLDRVVAGNHDLEGSVGQLLQRLDAFVSSRASSEAVGNLGTLVENRTLPSEDYATPENLEPLWNAYAVSEEEFTGRTLPSEEYATGDGVAGIQALLEAIQGASFNAALHSLVKIVEGLDQKLNAADYTAPPSEESIRAELDANSTKLANLDAPVSSRATPDDVQVEVVGEGGLTLDALQSELGALKGAGFDPGTDTLEKIREGVDAKLSADAYTAPDSAQTVAAAVIDTPEFRKILAFAAHRMRWDDGDPHVLVFYEADGETEAFRVRVAPGGEREVVE